MGFRSVIVNAYEDKKEQGQFDLLAGKAAEFYKNNTSENIVLLGNVRFGQHALDAILLTKSSIVILEFKNYGGRIRVSENIWEKLRQDGTFEIEVKGGTGGKTPREQAEINQRGVIKACEEILGREFPRQTLNKSQIFPVAIVFNQPVSVSLASSAAQPSWLKISQNEQFLSLLDSLRKNPHVFNNYEIEKLADVIGARTSKAIHNPYLEEAKKMFANKSYSNCINLLDEKKQRGFKEADYMRAVCLYELRRNDALSALTNVRHTYNLKDTLIYEATILYKGLCGSPKDIKEAKRLAEEGWRAGVKNAYDLQQEIRYDESKVRVKKINECEQLAFLNILAYIALPATIALFILIYIYLPKLLSYNVILLFVLGLLFIPVGLSKKEAVYLNAEKWIPMGIKLFPMSFGRCTFVKQEDIKQKAAFYSFGCILQVLPFICATVLVFMFKDLEWVKGINHQYFPLHTFSRIFFWSYLFYALASIMFIASRYWSYIDGDIWSVFSGKETHAWEIKPNKALLQESIIMAAKLILPALIISVITTIITIFI